MSHIALHVPGPVAAPRGAALAAALFALLLEALRRGFAAFFGAPDARMRRLAEAESVRRYATSLAHSDPALASDLFAAADRHTIND